MVSKPLAESEESTVLLRDSVLGWMTGFEPATSGATVRRRNERLCWTVSAPQGSSSPTFRPRVATDWPNMAERIFAGVSSKPSVGEQSVVKVWRRAESGEAPRRQGATTENMAGITKDISLVLDGQQRITSLFIGLRGSYRHFFYRCSERSRSGPPLHDSCDQKSPQGAVGY
jgi:hypothetical protein